MEVTEAYWLLKRKKEGLSLSICPTQASCFNKKYIDRKYVLIHHNPRTKTKKKFISYFFCLFCFSFIFLDIQRLKPFSQEITRKKMTMCPCTPVVLSAVIHSQMSLLVTENIPAVHLLVCSSSELIRTILLLLINIKQHGGTPMWHPTFSLYITA